MNLIKNVISVVLFVAVGLLAGLGAKSLYAGWSRPAPVSEADYSRLHRDAGAEVLLFGTSTCPYCKQARAFLDDRKVAYRDLNIDQSSEAAQIFAELGEKGVPVLLAGNRLVRGFNSVEYEQSIAHVR